MGGRASGSGGESGGKRVVEGGANEGGRQRSATGLNGQQHVSRESRRTPCSRAKGGGSKDGIFYENSRLCKRVRRGWEKEARGRLSVPFQASTRSPIANTPFGSASGPLGLCSSPTLHPSDCRQRRVSSRAKERAIRGESREQRPRRTIPYGTMLRRRSASQVGRVRRRSSLLSTVETRFEPPWAISPSHSGERGASSKQARRPPMVVTLRRRYSLSFLSALRMICRHPRRPRLVVS